MIYLDNAATTRMDDRVLAEMLPYLKDVYGNPSSVYALGRQSHEAVAEARRKCAALIGAGENEIFFTSGGTESDNWALRAALRIGRENGKNHIITTKIEHHAILNTLSRLEEDGLCEVTYLRPDAEGFVTAQHVKDAIREDTILVSIMTANNEIGTIEPIAEIGEVCTEAGVLFHTDAVQAYGQIPIDVHEMHIDFLSASSHKIYGPKGCGLMYANQHLPVRSMIQGGPQEHNRRAGTENVPGIVGFGKATELADASLTERRSKESRIRDHMISRLLHEIRGCVLNGATGDKRLPGNVSVCIPGKSGELMLILLDRQDICASSGSACASGSLDPSHVLTAIGREPVLAAGALRLTLSGATTMEEADTAVDAIVAISRK